MIPDAVTVRLTPEERAVLEARLRAPTMEQRQVFRARIVLLAAEGRSTRSIARELRTMPRTVSGWRGRFAREGLAGLEDRPHPGAAPKYGAESGRRILALLDEPPPKGYGRWTGPLIAEALGDVHEQQVWRFLRAQKIDLAGRKSWCESNDPEFVAKAAEVVGLYMAPPENAIVVCVDEKPSIQALERAQGYLKLPSGRTLTGRSHDYKRNGTSTLFAAFEVATGKVSAVHKKRRRRIEFLDFMNGIVAAYPTDTAIHVVLDNLNTHKPKNDRWLKRHPNVHFHFTPTRASWLNQVEIWFSILQGNSLHDASFTSVKQLKEHIDAFIETYNQSAMPFVWTKAKVHQHRFKGRRISES
ncbi:MAG: IS630 family transposase [Hyphomicrobiales bacterium]